MDETEQSTKQTYTYIGPIDFQQKFQGNSMGKEKTLQHIVLEQWDIWEGKKWICNSYLILYPESISDESKSYLQKLKLKPLGTDRRIFSTLG